DSVRNKQLPSRSTSRFKVLCEKLCPLYPRTAHLQRQLSNFGKRRLTLHYTIIKRLRNCFPTPTYDGIMYVGVLRAMTSAIHSANVVNRGARSVESQSARNLNELY